MMVRLRKIIFSSLLALFVLFLFGSGQSVKAASYDSNTLGDYGIPDDVIWVMLNNSICENGESPTKDGQTPTSFTIGDLTKLKTVSLATRTKQDDGSYKSTPNSTVADWVANGTAKRLYDVSDNVYALNTEGKVTGNSGSLANKALVFDEHPLAEHYCPPFNMLMQIIASANNATTVDLTGVTSEVKDTTLAQSLISLFQTPRLTSINTLLLGSDNLTDAGFYKMGDTVLNVKDTQNLTSLDLSNNGISQVAWSRNFPIAQNLTDLNLSGNPVQTISDTLNRFLQPIVDKNGTADLSSSKLDVGNYNTIQYIVSLLNMASGIIRLSDSSINAVATASAVTTSIQLKLNDQAIANALPQLTNTTIQVLLKANDDGSSKLSSDTVAQLTAKLNDGKIPTGNSVTVTNNLNFGTNTLNSLNSTYTTSGILDLQATISPGSALTAKMDPWEAVDGNSSFKGNLTLPSDGSNGIFTDDKNLNADDTSTVLYNNDGSASKNISQTLTGITLQIPEDQRAAIQATKYKTTITWNVDTKPSATAN